MRTVERLSLPFGPQRVEIELPDGAEIVRVGAFETGAGLPQPSMWVLVESGTVKTKRSFHTLGDFSTGVQDGWEYVGSYDARYAEGPTTTYHLFADVPGA